MCPKSGKKYYTEYTSVQPSTSLRTLLLYVSGYPGSHYSFAIQEAMVFGSATSLVAQARHDNLDG